MITDNTYAQLHALCKERYSCRAYDAAKGVDEKVLSAVLDIARLAPSACNRQPWLFIIADSQAERDAVVESYPREWIASAPVYIIACGIHEDAWHRPHDGKDHTDVDLSIAIEHLCLGATAMGLATCWVCNFDPEKITSAFNLPEGLEPIAIIPLGYAAEGTEAPAKKRKDLSEIVRRGGF